MPAPEEFLEHETEEGRPGDVSISGWSSVAELLDKFRPLKGCTKQISITETFFSVQGEGLGMGRAAFFVRTQGCDLACPQCDSAWSNEANAGTKFPPEQLAMAIHQNGWPYVVVTGGEPLLWQAPLALSLQLARAAFWNGGKDLFIELETNGTIMPSMHLVSVTSRFVVSPKLSNMGEENAKKAANLYGSSMRAWKKLAEINRACFKFVCRGLEDVPEIKGFVKNHKLPQEKCWLMPMGYTKEDILGRHMEVMEACRAERFNFSSRLHILSYGNKKGT